MIIRLVDLEAGDLVVARARSRIPIGRNSAQVLDRVRGRSLGLGQIAAVHGLSLRRKVLDHGANAQTFWRKYQMAAADPDLYFEIREMFPRVLYQGLIQTWRWPRSEEPASGVGS